MANNIDDQQDNSEIESIVDNNNVKERAVNLDNLNIDENVEQIGAVRKGRPPGLTAAESLRCKKESLRERENRFREEGIRR